MHVWPFNGEKKEMSPGVGGKEEEIKKALPVELVSVSLSRSLFHTT